MPIHFREHPLLNTPSLTAILLGCAAEGGSSLEECLGYLEGILATAQESPPVSREDILGRLQMLTEALTVAGLLAPIEPGRFELTDRGRAALAEHPTGLSRADLLTFPEFAADVADRGRNRSASDPHARAFDAGFVAFLAGAAVADNPHPPDTADHQAWENGWSEGLDRNRT